jgi:hypothetical protein
VVIDPNGYFGKNKDGTRCVPDGRLANFARTFPRMDLIFNLNITLYRRAAAHRKNGVPGWVDRFCPHPKELPRIFSRSHGLIQIRPTCGHHFLTLVLRNVKTGDHKKMNLYDIHGRQGSEMLRELRNVGQLELI